MRQAETIVWAGGEHPFRLAIGELRSLEQRCDAGVSVVLLRLIGQQWKVDDVYQPIRLGLIGGGMADKDAGALVAKVMETESLFGLSVLATDVLRRFIMWGEADAPGEGQGETATKPLSPQTAPAGADTTPQEL